MHFPQDAYNTQQNSLPIRANTVYPKKYAHGFVVLCFVVVMQSFIMNSHEVFIHIHQGCFAGTGAIVRLPQCQWSKPGGYGKISQCITTTKHSKAKTVCIFLGIYCMSCPIGSLSYILFISMSCNIMLCCSKCWQCSWLWPWMGVDHIEMDIKMTIKVFLCHAQMDLHIKPRKFVPLIYI